MQLKLHEPNLVTKYAGDCNNLLVKQFIKKIDYLYKKVILIISGHKLKYYAIKFVSYLLFRSL